jgi:hypothetical protein
VTTGKVALNAVIDGVYDALNVTAFTDLSAVFNDVEQPTTFPVTWITPGEPPEEPFDTFGKIGAICHLDLNIYSQYEGDKEAITIADKATELLHHVGVSLVGDFTVINLVREPIRWAYIDIDGVATRHLITPFAIQVLES